MKLAAMIAALVVTGSLASAAQEHAAKGLVLKVDAAHGQITVSCDAIPGYMEAMEMPFMVSNREALSSVKAGSIIRFTIVERHKAAFAENIRPVTNFEPEPAEAGALTALNSADAAAKALEIGQTIPDFKLTDQAGGSVQLSQFRGKVVALTFGYSRCPNPNYCLRLSRNLAEVERRFHDRAGRDLVLLTIAIDPEYDKGTALARYAQSFGADVKDWHFLTGSVPEVHQVAALFGMDFWNSEGLLTHTLHTVIVDRGGRLAANVDGNQFSSQQLGDLVLEVMDGGGRP